jgi:hypothetical protein
MPPPTTQRTAPAPPTGIRTVIADAGTASDMSIAGLHDSHAAGDVRVARPGNPRCRATEHGCTRVAHGTDFGRGFSSTMRPAAEGENTS